ncbi:hypothetical protein BDR26DRAFT_1007399 [Obelidium mucronatum]|nr:hypothetical protein BDR26DRAFT_1007399 [Obelidium mucronatum]
MALISLLLLAFTLVSNVANFVSGQDTATTTGAPIEEDGSYVSRIDTDIRNAMLVLNNAPPCFSECVNIVLDGDSPMETICLIASNLGVSGIHFVKCVQANCDKSQAIQIGTILTDQSTVLAKACTNMGVVMKKALATKPETGTTSAAVYGQYRTTRSDRDLLGNTLFGGGSQFALLVLCLIISF